MRVIHRLVIGERAAWLWRDDRLIAAHTGVDTRATVEAALRTLDDSRAAHLSVVIGPTHAQVRNIGKLPPGLTPRQVRELVATNGSEFFVGDWRSQTLMASSTTEHGTTAWSMPRWLKDEVTAACTSSGVRIAEWLPLTHAISIGGFAGELWLADDSSAASVAVVDGRIVSAARRLRSSVSAATPLWDLVAGAPVQWLPGSSPLAAQTPIARPRGRYLALATAAALTLVATLADSAAVGRAGAAPTLARRLSAAETPALTLRPMVFLREVVAALPSTARISELAYGSDSLVMSLEVNDVASVIASLSHTPSVASLQQVGAVEAVGVADADVESLLRRRVTLVALAGRSGEQRAPTSANQRALRLAAPPTAKEIPAAPSLALVSMRVQSQVQVPTNESGPVSALDDRLSLVGKLSRELSVEVEELTAFRSDSADLCAPDCPERPLFRGRFQGPPSRILELLVRASESGLLEIHRFRLRNTQADGVALLSLNATWFAGTCVQEGC